MNFLMDTTVSPEEYAERAVLAREVGEAMLSRLEWMTFKPRVIVDLGCGTGEISARLQSRYPEAQVVALDLSEAMLNHAARHQEKISRVCAHAACLPFADQSVDLLFANFLLLSENNLEECLMEWKRVLREDGLLIFSALGPDSFKPWQEYLTSGMTPALLDMHDLGDMLLQQLADPVVDVDYYTLSYREPAKLFRELLMTGMLLQLPDRQDEMPANAEGRFDVIMEVIIAHAFAPAIKDECRASADGIVRVPLSHLRRQLGK